jgi:hypothetical protein
MFGCYGQILRSTANIIGSSEYEHSDSSGDQFQTRTMLQSPSTASASIISTHHDLAEFALWNVAQLNLLDSNSFASSPVESPFITFSTGL